MSIATAVNNETLARVCARVEVRTFVQCSAQSRREDSTSGNPGRSRNGEFRLNLHFISSGLNWIRYYDLQNGYKNCNGQVLVIMDLQRLGK